MEIYSIFTITTKDIKGKYTTHEGEAVSGFGESVMKFIRKQYPRFTRFVLEGFEIDGIFKSLNMRTHNKAR